MGQRRLGHFALHALLSGRVQHDDEVLQEHLGLVQQGFGGETTGQVSGACGKYVRFVTQLMIVPGISG